MFSHTFRCSAALTFAFVVGACATDVELDVDTVEQHDTTVTYVLDDVQVNINNTGWTGSSYNGASFADVEMGSQEVEMRGFLTGGMGLDATWYHPRKVINIGCSSTGQQLVNFPRLVDDYYDWAGYMRSPGMTNEPARIVYSESTPVLPPFIALRKPGVGEEAIKQSPSIGGYVTAHVASISGMIPSSWVGNALKLLLWTMDLPEFEWETKDWGNTQTELSLAVKFKCKSKAVETPSGTPQWASCPAGYTGANGFLCFCSAGFGSSNTRYCAQNVVGTSCQGYQGPGSSAFVTGTVVSCIQQ